MMRVHILAGALAVLGFAAGCRQSQTPTPVVVHVLRDSTGLFADKLRRADLQFGLTRPSLKSGKAVMIATNEGNSFAMLMKRFNESTPEVLILQSQGDAPPDRGGRNGLGDGRLVCGQHPAFIPSTVSGEQREAAQMYVKFLQSHCEIAH